ncbi:hypothetical protein ACNKHT_26960 [Shigella flexneri]
MAVDPEGVNIMKPGGLVKDSISALSLGLGLMLRYGGLAAHSDALLHSQRCPVNTKSVLTPLGLWATSIF